jgi:pimeloyl-ACP methyl ester carboxylesterase
MGAIDYANDTRQHSALILFLTGITGNRDQWNLVFQRLRGVAADLAFGRPVLPNGTSGEGIPDVTDIANAIAEELRSAHDGEVVIVSHSVGAFVALGIAHEIPDKVKSVILVNGGLTSIARFLDRPAREFLARPLAGLAFLHLFVLVSTPAPERLKRAIGSRKWMTRAVLGKLVSDSAMNTREVRSALLNEAGGPRVLRSLWKSRHHWRKFIAYAREIPTNVLFIVGDRDPISTEADAKSMAALLPNARTCVLKGVGHAAPLEAADTIAEVVRDAIEAPDAAYSSAHATNPSQYDRGHRPECRKVSP